MEQEIILNEHNKQLYASMPTGDTNTQHILCLVSSCNKNLPLTFVSQ